jgi:hypothetical protein
MISSVITFMSLFVTPLSAQLPPEAQQKFAESIHRLPGIQAMIANVKDGKISQEEITALDTILRHTKEVAIHQMRGAGTNKVYLSKDGKQEGVYDEKGHLVADGINDGNYNYFNPRNDALRHFAFDIFPWIRYGHSRNDPTSQDERLSYYVRDLRLGMRDALPTLTSGRTAKVSLDTGSQETVALFFSALEKGGCRRPFPILEDRQNVDFKTIDSVTACFEKGLKAMLESPSR